MKKVLIKKTYVPKFMACSSHEEPELNYVIHTGTPFIMAEVADDYDPDEVDYLKDNNFLFKVVELEDDTSDLLVIIDIAESFLEGKNDVDIFDRIMDILDEMAVWHRSEIADLENYK